MPVDVSQRCERGTSLGGVLWLLMTCHVLCYCRQCSQYLSSVDESVEDGSTKGLE